MTNEEKIIQENIGTKNPFLVPDDYFEQFAERLMEKLPDKEQQSAHQSTLTAKRSPFTVHRSKLRIFLAAACLCVAIFSIAIYFNKSLLPLLLPPTASTMITWIKLPTTSC